MTGQALFLVFVLGYLIPSLGIVPASASERVGCVVTWTGKAPKLRRVHIPRFIDGGIGNELVQIDASEMNHVIDPDGPLCFPLNDERLLQVDTYYWATRQIQFYNRILRRISVRPLKQVKIKLIPMAKVPLFDDEGGYASVEKKTVALIYRRPIVDPTILFHEVGHLIQAHLEGTKNAKRLTAEKQAIDEGFADLIVAFFSGETVMFPRTLGCEPSRDINELVRLPEDALTFEQALRNLLARDSYEKTCPKSAQTAAKMLRGEIPVPLNEYEPHHLSRVVSRPIWRAFQYSPYIRDSVFRAFARHNISTFLELANAVLNETKHRPVDHAILAREFQEVGLSRRPATQY